MHEKYQRVSQLPADLPKIDFDGLKKRMPRHETLLDSLKKQYDSIAISYGSIPDTHNKEIEDWVKYNVNFSLSNAFL